MNEARSTKALRNIARGAGRHWVGDGFPVRTLFAYHDLGAELSPFLLLDYGGPAEFPPTTARRGVGEHPHRGFETVTIVYDGEVEHRDSSGGGGMIGPGDVQWMTAAAGIVHEEFHGRDFAQRGGRFEMVQLWVNLPRKDKFAAPRYQAIASAAIPTVSFADGNGTARVIAGEFRGVRGPARTFTPMQVVDLQLATARSIEFEVPDGWTTALVVLDGALRVGDAETIATAELAIFDRAGSSVVVESSSATHALLLAGQPIDEPIVGSGPFVMNTRREIHDAIADYQSGKMGHLD